MRWNVPERFGWICRSSEFGAVDLVVDEIAEDKVNDVTKAGQYESEKYVHDAVITLVSDAILYNEHGIRRQRSVNL